jgi:hypothetical protein
MGFASLLVRLEKHRFDQFVKLCKSDTPLSPQRICLIENGCDSTLLRNRRQGYGKGLKD